MNSIFIFSLTSKGYVKSVVPIACFVRRKCHIVNRLEIVVNFVLVFVFTNICLFDGFLSTVSHLEQNLRTWNCNSSVLILYALPLYCLQRSKYFIRFWQSLSHVCIFVITFSAYKWHISDLTDERCEIDVPLVWLASLYELCNNTLFMFAWNNKPSVVPGIRPPLKYLIHW